MDLVENLKIGILGLGYVGLPLAVEFAKVREVIGFDISEKRVAELNSGIDSTLEVDTQALLEAKQLSFTSDIESLSSCNCYIVTVPTPVTESKQPDLQPLLAASRSVSSILKKGDIVVYESTVYPGATEGDCVPVLEAGSKLKFNSDFFVGYSPERINPGDSTHRLKDIVKVTSGSDTQTAEVVDALYSSIVSAGTFRASSIMVAEAAKVIENTQRDINIALVNELAMIFDKIGIDTEEVLRAAESKWNFLPFRPGLVGGHCISIDPYYLTHKAQVEGYNPKMILAGREINDGMGLFVAQNLIKHMARKSINISDSNILIMGCSFKENCPDVRNTRVLDVFEELQDYQINVELYDPWVNDSDALSVFGTTASDLPKMDFYDAVVVAVAHDIFANLGLSGLQKYLKSNHVVYDLKHLFERNNSTIRL
jgi:UDP-N-acetyl-D-galactosamine dehydrogenase